jgi:ABC-type branched-subunit amino acid transport system substrate-binding protein
VVAGLAVLGLLAASVLGQAQSGAASEPNRFGGAASHADLGSRPYEFTGPQGDVVDPGHIEEVRIGLLTPLRGPRASAGQGMRRGARLALAEANRQGGLRGTPFVLVERHDDQVWGSAREVVALAYSDQVWAVLGSVGGEGSHVAEQVITKAHLALVSPASSDASLTQIGIPWMFRCMPDDDRMAAMLAEHLIRDQGHRTIVGLAGDERDSRLRMAALEKAARRLATPLAMSLRFAPGERVFEPHLERIEGLGADAVVVLGSPQDAAAVVRALRARGIRASLYAGPAAATAELAELAGSSSEGLTAVVPCFLDHGDPLVRSFAEGYLERFGEPPDAVAAYAYDAASLLVEAVRAGGLNRAAIRDALAAHAEGRGVTGRLSFDGSGANTADPVLVTVRSGRLVPWQAEAS